MKLQVHALLEAATAKAKADAFGDMWFLEPLGVRVEALNSEERQGTHAYAAQDFGLSTEQLEHDFRFYTEEFL